MTEEKETLKETKEEVVTEKKEPQQNYLDIIQKQQEQLKNKVDRDDYDKLSQDNAKLLDIILNGKDDSDLGTGEETPDVAELRKKVFNAEGNLSNLEYAKKVLALRKQVLAENGYDVFAPQVGASGAAFSDSDYATAEKVANALQECVDTCNGDSGVFTAKLNSMIAEDSPALIAKLKAKRR